MNKSIIILAHNIRSTHNVGAIFRTCDGFGVQEIILSGYTPYPATVDDTRLPHISNKLTTQIHKTALGAEQTVPFRYYEDPFPIITALQAEGYIIAGLEQDENSILLPNYTSPQKLVLVLGEEVEGIPIPLRRACDTLLEIPMVGRKESFNVSVATGIALYALTLQ